MRRIYALAVVASAGIVVAGITVPDVLRDRQRAHPIALALAGIGGAALCVTPAWRTLRHMVTMIHEIGHAACACLLGGAVKRITFDPDASGLATYALPPGWGFLRGPIVTGAGYAAPTVAGITCATAATGGLAGTWLWCCTGFTAAALLLMIRNLWDAWFALALGLVLTVSVRALDGWGPAAAIAASALGGVLCAGAVKAAAIQVNTSDITGSDADAIGRTLHLPARFVAWVQVTVCVVGACYGASLLAGIA